MKLIAVPTTPEALLRIAELTEDSSQIHGPVSHPEEWESGNYIGNDSYTLHLEAGGFFEVFDHETPAKMTSELPELCFAFLASNDPGKYVIAITRNEMGYSPTTYDETDPDKAKKIVELMNKKLDVSPEQADLMLHKSMFGWRNIILSSGIKIAGKYASVWDVYHPRMEGNKGRGYVIETKCTVDFKTGEIDAEAATEDILITVDILDSQYIEVYGKIFDVAEMELQDMGAFRSFIEELSLNEAKQIASDKADVRQSSKYAKSEYHGKILGITDLHVVQSIGRANVVHHLDDLAHKPENGAMCKIIYDGCTQGQVKTQSVVQSTQMKGAIGNER